MSVERSDKDPRGQGAGRPRDGHKLGASGKRGPSERYTVKYLPPPWKRSLTESGMFSRTTKADVVIVVMFAIGVLAIIAWAATSGFSA